MPTPAAPNATAMATEPLAPPPAGRAEPTDAADDALPVCDTRLKYVRVTERRPDGLVAFEFSIGWPELAVELMLPAAAFDEFCARHAVQRLDR